ncbi:MAG: HNH endonuclease signature motif containing protein [Actinobacteria bacterium]|nr:HNH endonuclease signature motif containing protein [Actinomycetota bacterium]
MQHWLSWKCGLASVAASERLRVAKALQELPLVKQAFWDGHLSYSKVRELTRVVTPETEHRWCEVAQHLTAGQLAKLVAAGRRATRQEDAAQVDGRSFRWATDEDGGITITVRLPADSGAAAVAAVRAAAKIERGVKLAQTQADAFVELLLGRSEVSVEVIAHVSDDGHAILDNGNPISTELAECLSCDGAVTTVVDTPEGPIERDRQAAPNRRQRRFLQRRHPTCQFPGCHHAGTFDAHHVIERAKGGRTKLNNLVRLCWLHHRMVHLHGLVLTLHRDRTLTVATADGRAIDRPIPITDFTVDRPEDPNRLGGWSGQQMDLPYVVATVLGG